MTSEYTDIHRAFLQVVMSRGSISRNIGNQALAELRSKHGQAAPTDEDLTVLIDEINKQIRRFDQRIDVVTSMYDGKTFIVMVNTIDSAIMRLQSTYEPFEIEFFRLLMKEISLASDHSLSMINILNLMNRSGNKDPKFTMSKAEKLVNDWIEEAYFYNDNGIVYLGVRSVAEFGDFLRTKFNVDSCYLCKAILLKGVDCKADTCNGRFHTECIRKFMAKNAKCPKCKTAWENPIP